MALSAPLECQNFQPIVKIIPMKYSNFTQLFSAILIIVFSMNIHAQNTYQNMHNAYDVEQSAVSVTVSGEDNAVFAANHVQPVYLWLGWDFNIPIDTTHGIRIYKTDNQGNILWDRVYSEENMIFTVKSIRATQDGGFIVCGNSFERNGAYTSEFGLLLKVDSQGNKEWMYYPSTTTVFYNNQQLTTNKVEYIYAEETPEKKIIAIAKVNLQAESFDEINGYQLTQLDLVLVHRLDRNGIYDQIKLFDLGENENVVGIRTTHDNEYIVVCSSPAYRYFEDDSTDPPTPNLEEVESTYVLKLDNQLNIVFKKYYALSPYSEVGIGVKDFYPSDFEIVNSHEETIGIVGDIYFEDGSASKPTIFHLGLNGSIREAVAINMYASDMGLYECTHDIAVNAEEYFYISGSYLASYSGARTPFVISLDNVSQPSDYWSKNYGMAGRDEDISELAVVNDRNLVMAGEAIGWYTPSVGALPINTYQIYTNDLGEAACNWANIPIDPRIVVFSQYDAEVDTFDTDILSLFTEETVASVENQILTCDDGNIFIPTIIGWNVSAPETDLETLEAVISPNPASESLHIQLNGGFNIDEPVTATLYNIQGQLLQSFFLNAASERINLKEEWHGLHLLRVEQGEKVLQKKLMIR